MNLRRLNLAEGLSFFRVISFPIILLFIYLDMRSTTAWLYLIFFSTDTLDGVVARLLNMESDRRAKLDTLGDILYLLTGLVGYYTFAPEHFLKNILLIGLVLGLYLLQFILALSKWGKPSSYHTWLAKLAAIFQVAFFVWMFFVGPHPFFFYAAAGISLLDALEDILITLSLKERRSHIRGLFWLTAPEEPEKAVDKGL
ncbi:CDP-alcohol phosphatidyltransferase family protein [Cesiribacter andamanensis]|uniref:CDP-diacylglycerol--glycerol-3-phosphate 3-phosphatidyltransferase n=1 Tax=Cesiribacter andamanensis AMV16 TaxID=1279009 RepID=M7NJP6_9BACT|nr:CDP-alcohol phosphatidyltransferase family protein [Cesiribacter andamanensis]EMR02020.1 CDP-diacylglycerol--glycerol-3-phosphate 3-phosphatidyltransferase [Cesiribacter andamanensis AMV16]